MADSIYTYVEKFPEFASKFPESSVVSGSQNETDCKSFESLKLTEYKGNKPQFIDKCTKIIKYLEDHKGEFDFKPAFCKYINYWLYDTLKDMDPFSSDALLKEFYSKIRNLNVCQAYKKHMNKEIYNGFKELHKLYEHFNNYKTESIKSGSINCNHGDECVNLYESHFTSFGSWLRPRLPGDKNKTKKLEKKMQELQNTPDVRNSRYTVPYHSSYS
ncbi:Plasmodium vivax Vir protein, putative [Plasmodium vivax]|uniref:Vir protein, putative n=1 Tax=Plasmodium vivax TaxID=5855 RepID=A0A1G4E1B1_PLAVI|nr:Plasmodium vivax Vir protein, putative [Plasmodium vivax]SCA60556.1 Plasmodium vivax Vir protein, putative [Plasmodium vivax]